MKLIQIITRAVRSIIKGNDTMRHNSNIPAMAGMTSKNGQLTITAPVKTKRTRTADPYAICNIGKRIWNPLIEMHVEFQEFYRLIREDNVDLSTLKINSIVNCGTETGKHQFNGTLTEAEWLNEMDLFREAISGKLLSSSEFDMNTIKTSIDTAHVQVQNRHNTNRTPGPVFEGDHLARVCVSQATEIDDLKRQLDKGQKSISGIEDRLRGIHHQALEITSKAGGVVDSLSIALGIEDEVELPF